MFQFHSNMWQFSTSLVYSYFGETYERRVYRSSCVMATIAKGKVSETESICNKIIDRKLSYICCSICNYDIAYIIYYDNMYRKKLYQILQFICVFQSFHFYFLWWIFLVRKKYDYIDLLNCQNGNSILCNDWVSKIMFLK